MDGPEHHEEPASPVSPSRQRKSVCFSDEALVIEATGKVTTMDATEVAQDSAQSHSLPVEDPPAEGQEGLPMKKKKKKVKIEGDDEGADGAADGADGADEGGLDLNMKKKKKKKSSKKEEGDDFAAKLAALDLDKEGGDAAAAAAAAGAGAPEEQTDEQSGDMDKGTGIFAHDNTKPITYDLMLSRFFHLLAQKNPDHASSGSKSYKIPPPQCMREGNKKTIFANIPEICKRMKRTEEHVTAYLFAELGTNGSVDGSRRLVIKGRFQQKQIENVLRKYIIEYVTCKTCRSPDTELNKGENRLYFITCNSCGSRRSVTAIKTGFSAQVGKRRKMQKG